MSRILLTGGSGALGQELLKINPEIVAPNSLELDVARFNPFDGKLDDFDLIIHAAAMTDIQGS